MTVWSNVTDLKIIIKIMIRMGSVYLFENFDLESNDILPLFCLS
jgi:hypothetical protein